MEQALHRFRYTQATPPDWRLRQTPHGLGSLSALGVATKHRGLPWFVLYCILSGACPLSKLSFSGALLAIGVRVEGVGACSMLVMDIDMHTTKGFEASRLAITDRWGMYREFDESGMRLHARVGHLMRTVGGCPRYLEFHSCGCACPYMHARSSENGQWLTATARRARSSHRRLGTALWRTKTQLAAC